MTTTSVLIVKEPDKPQEKVEVPIMSVPAKEEAIIVLLPKETVTVALPETVALATVEPPAKDQAPAPKSPHNPVDGA